MTMTISQGTINVLVQVNRIVSHVLMLLNQAPFALHAASQNAEMLRFIRKATKSGDGKPQICLPEDKGLGLFME